MGDEERLLQIMEIVREAKDKISKHCYQDTELPISGGHCTTCLKTKANAFAKIAKILEA